MTEPRSPRRGRRAPPPREILARTVRTEDLPDVVRPGAGAAPERPATVDPAAGPSGDAAPAAELVRSVIAAGRLPLRLTEAALDGQARAIGDWIASGAAPATVVPGAKILQAQLGFLAGVVRSFSGSPPDRTSG